MRNRTALEATSLTMRAAVRPVTAEITRETRAALCRALKIAFGIRKVMQQFVDPTIPSRVDPQKQIAFNKAIEAYISTAKARARPGEGAELDPRVTMDSYDTTCYVIGLFGGYINGSRINVYATIRPQFVHFHVHLGRAQSRNTITVTKDGVTLPARRLTETVRHSAAWLKRKERVTLQKIWRASRRGAMGHAAARRRAARDRKLQDVANRLAEANYNRPETIAIKVAMRAIKACATSLHATMW
jgi:hypothetical protein